MMRTVRTILLLGCALSAVFLATSGRFLVINKPRRSDVIVVLAGEIEERPTGALELLAQGYAPQLVLDVPADTRIYDSSQLELARKYVQALPQAAAITLCPIHATSTRREAQEVAGCVRNLGAKSILLVTSDYHTRRAFSIFKRMTPEFDYSVAAIPDSREFGTPWWQRREWAKVNLQEWTKLMWWELIDRWR